MITWLIWIIWIWLSSIQERLLNLTTGGWGGGGGWRWGDVDHFVQVLSVLIKSCVFHRFFFVLITSWTRVYKIFFVVLQHRTTVCLWRQWPACPTSKAGVWTRHLIQERVVTSRLVSGRRLGPADVRPGGLVGTSHLSTGPAIYSFLACHGREQGPCCGATCTTASRQTLWLIPGPDGSFQDGVYVVAPVACHCGALSGAGNSSHHPSSAVPDLRGTSHDS